MEWRFKFVILYVGYVVQCSAMSFSELEEFANFLKKTSQLDETLKKGTSYDFDEDEKVTDHAWEDSGKFEGDLILNERQRRLIVQDIAEGLSRNGLRDSTKKWPDNEVIYYIQKEHFTEDQVQAINDGIEDLGRASCVKFRPYRKGDRDAVVVQGNRRGCFSHVGYQGGYQVLNLNGRHPVGRGCFRHGTVIHEFLHALGFYHMQSSPDRDDYVDINWENIAQPHRHNFRKYNAFSVSDFGVGYDYDSVLHYSRRAFSTNGQDTIVPKQGGAEIGQRTGLSDKDTQKLNKMYCDADSNNEGEESNAQTSSSKKKKPKNKPFEGQGIGYHQGKTVVIKLLPDEKAETYQLNSKPEFHLFDHFSKPPQVLSQKETEIYGDGRSTVVSFKPYVSEDFYNEAKTKEQYDKNKETENIADEVPKPIVTKQAEDDVIEKSLPKLPDDKIPDPSHTITDDLSDAFDRLSKIIRSHVYPSHSPDFRAYKSSSDYKDYSEFLKPKEYSSIFKETKVNSKSGDINRTLDKNDHQVEIYDKKQDDHAIKESPKQSYEFLTPDITKEGEASYRTSYPFKTHKNISNESLEIKTPEYATYENLKNKHIFSELYQPNHNKENEEVIRQHQLFGEFVPLYDDWYKNEELYHNPADYDRNLYPVDKESNNLIRQQEKSESNDNASPTGEPRLYYTGSYSPQKKQAYLLFGVPVPLTKDWFKVDGEKLNEYYPLKYYIPIENSKSHEDKR